MHFIFSVLPLLLFSHFRFLLFRAFFGTDLLLCKHNVETKDFSEVFPVSIWWLKFFILNAREYNPFIKEVVQRLDLVK